MVRVVLWQCEVLRCGVAKVALWERKIEERKGEK